MLNPEEREIALKKMDVIVDDFYRQAIGVNNHPFIEFAGIMQAYIKTCQRAYEAGIDFSECNRHSGNQLPMEGFEIDYLNEKLSCIFDGRIIANAEIMADQVDAMNDDVLILRLQKNFDLKSNREVANFLELSESMVSKILKRKKKLSFYYRLKILNKFGFIRDLASEIQLERLGKRLANFSINHQKSLADADIKILTNRGTMPLNKYCSHLIQAFERLFKFENNDSLAEVLGVDSSTISNIKMGRQGIGEESCLKILYRIEVDFDLNLIERATSSTERMVEIIDSYVK